MHCLALLQRSYRHGEQITTCGFKYTEVIGVYELRARHGHVNYRILYFFHGASAAILAHALTKEDRIPQAEIERAIRYMRALENAPGNHVCEENLGDGQD